MTRSASSRDARRTADAAAALSSRTGSPEARDSPRGSAPRGSDEDAASRIQDATVSSRIEGCVVSRRVVPHSCSNVDTAASPQGPSIACRIAAAAAANATSIDARANVDAAPPAKRASSHAAHRRAPRGRPGSIRAKLAASASQISPRAEERSVSVPVPVSVSFLFVSGGAKPTSRRL